MPGSQPPVLAREAQGPGSPFMFDQVELYCRPASVREALRLLQTGRGRARVVAGGTDFVLQPDDSIRTLIDITRTGLTYIRAKAGSIAIGATTTMAQLEEAPEIQALAGGVLAHAAASCGSIQLRNVATIGGNMAQGSPAADLAGPLLALDASVVLAFPNGSRRKIGIADYLAAPRTGGGTKALVIELRIPAPPAGSRCGWCFRKLGRTALDISLLNVTAGLQVDSRGKVKWARIALGAVAPAPLRVSAAENLMNGRMLDGGLLDEAAACVRQEVTPIPDQRASAAYRREMSGVLVRRALEECAAGARWPL